MSCQPYRQVSSRATLSLCTARKWLTWLLGVKIVVSLCLQHNISKTKEITAEFCRKRGHYVIGTGHSRLWLKHPTRPKVCSDDLCSLRSDVVTSGKHFPEIVYLLKQSPSWTNNSWMFFRSLWGSCIVQGCEQAFIFACCHICFGILVSETCR